MSNLLFLDFLLFLPFLEKKLLIDRRIKVAGYVLRALEIELGSSHISGRIDSPLEKRLFYGDNIIHVQVFLDLGGLIEVREDGLSGGDLSIFGSCSLAGVLKYLRESLGDELVSGCTGSTPAISIQVIREYFLLLLLSWRVLLSHLFLLLQFRLVDGRLFGYQELLLGECLLILALL